MSTDRFVNPYNFIKLPQNKAKAYTDADRHYGVIHYTITTKTPLFIPNSSNDEVFEESKTTKDHKSYDFYSYTDLSESKRLNPDFHEPVIPGSEIRGVVRSAYETLTDSCMHELNADTHPIKRVGARFKPGLLYLEKDGSYSLLDAQSIRIKKSMTDACWNDIQNGDCISFVLKKPNAKVQPPIEKFEKTLEEKEGYVSGYVLKWGDGTKKKSYHAYVGERFNPVQERLDINKVLSDIKAIVQSYKNQSTATESNKKAYDDYLNDLIDFKNGSLNYFFPINYSIVKNYTYFSPSIFSKEISNHTVGDLAGEFVPCLKLEHLCPACDLFGMVGEDAKASRIRFSDLQVKEKKNNLKDYYVMNKVTMVNLNGPKLGNVDFYLQKPSDDSTFWTYDYLIKNRRIIDAPGKLRGRKYYWHHRLQKISLRSVEPTRLNKTIRPLEAGITFTGNLYFDGISRKQINQLVWILNSGSKNLGLKLGMAKPLGLGSISCKVDAVEERVVEKIDSNLNYVLQKIDCSNVTYENVGFSKSVEAEFRKIASFDAVPEDLKICYPKTTDESDNRFEWFQANHHANQIPKEREDMFIEIALPNILDDDISMECFKKMKPLSRQNNFDSSSNKKPHSNFGSHKKKKPYNNQRGKW